LGPRRLHHDRNLWSPNRPLPASPAKARRATDAYSATNRPWTQPISFKHALFEVAIDVLKRAQSGDPKSIGSDRRHQLVDRRPVR
jgi:hypothetical protein